MKGNGMQFRRRASIQISSAEVYRDGRRTRRPVLRQLADDKVSRKRSDLHTLSAPNFVSPASTESFLETCALKATD